MCSCWSCLREIGKTPSFQKRPVQAISDDPLRPSLKRDGPLFMGSTTSIPADADILGHDRPKPDPRPQRGSNWL